ncbi:hypothetical protein AKJ51_02420 [candidate division MSBL1 archaeon SCGC-AAA382A20]|uniref:Cob(I)yrinic acid a,c-diamide adenosyltransferase n=1 Tax=candidate division MSBL1 archaeon SCGC-AAA382A20 TaxID=1698280 RepID=A0A133VKG3_9EURY|nr:hypothetical protein AKJ51_02420 [candidate division MSBL1 archaeon SCGC-AAA382A20]
MAEKGKEGNKLIQILTGEGKGKTTAAVGQVIRAIANNRKTFWVYFHKNPEDLEYGELKVLRDLGVKVRGFAKKHPHFYEDSSDEQMREKCLKGLEYLEKIFDKDFYDLVVLDELIISIRDEFLKEEEVIDLLERKPIETDIILTGRDASENLIKIANQANKIKNVKHPYDTKVRDRKGIDY